MMKLITLAVLLSSYSVFAADAANTFEKNIPFYNTFGFWVGLLGTVGLGLLFVFKSKFK